MTESERSEIRGTCMTTVFRYTKKFVFHVLSEKNKRKIVIICSKDYFSYRRPCMSIVTLSDKVCCRLLFSAWFYKWIRQGQYI